MEKTSTPFCFEDVCRYDWPVLRKPRRKRLRKPSFRSVVNQATRAGLAVAAYTVNPNGSVTVVPGNPPIACGESPVRAGESSVPTIANEWDEVFGEDDSYGPN